MTSERRIGARRPADVPSEVRALLEAGAEQTSNLMEQIALDQGVLLGSVLPSAIRHADELRVPKLTERMWAGGRVLLESQGIEGIHLARTWDSDTARSWGAMAVGLAPDIGLEERLALARKYASDDHFAVREWAWIAVRGHIADELTPALALLSEWSRDSDPLIRRFASESTRPRGVWCSHIAALKADPELAINLLEPLHSDPARYVQLSVGNWLNDAAKTRPDWTSSICRRWALSNNAATRAILKRGQRSLP